jgi:hypothetical protein
MARGTIRASKGYAVFRIVFGLIFIGLGVDQQFHEGPNGHISYFTLGIGALFVGYGFVALLTPKTFGTKLDIESPTATERLTELTRLKSEGLLSDSEYETKRQEILKGL